MDRLRDHYGLAEGYDHTRDQLREAVEVTSDLTAQLKLIGTDTMRTLEDETVNLFRTRFRSAMHLSEPLSSAEREQFSANFRSSAATCKKPFDANSL